MHIHADLTVYPETRGIHATFVVTDYPDEQWFLHDGLTMTQVTVDGQEVEVTRHLSSDPFPFSESVHLVEVHQHGSTMILDIDGQIPEIIAEVNLISFELVELAAYCAWHPVFASFPAFDFDASVVVAGREGAVVVGGAAKGKEGYWKSVAPSVDISVFWSPAVHEVCADAVRVIGRAENMALSDVAQGCRMVMEEYSSRWGVPDDVDVRVVVSPRVGWPYVRFPVIFLPESGEMSDVEHILRHELGHLWWHRAPISADWLNEGVAEYASLSGRDSVSQITAELKAELIGYEDDPAVDGTLPVHEASRRNLYVRPALALLMLEDRIGVIAVDHLLKAWLRHSIENSLDTQSALDAAHKLLSAPEAELLRTATLTPGWFPR